MVIIIRFGANAEEQEAPTTASRKNYFAQRVSQHLLAEHPRDAFLQKEVKQKTVNVRNRLTVTLDPISPDQDDAAGLTREPEAYLTGIFIEKEWEKLRPRYLVAAASDFAHQKTDTVYQGLYPVKSPGNPYKTELLATVEELRSTNNKSVFKISPTVKYHLKKT